MKSIQVCAAIALVFMTVSANAATISVASADGPDAIQAAIAGSSAGDIIELTDAGPYVENSVIATSNPITVRAAVPATITSTVVGSWFNPQGDGIQFGDSGYSRITLQTSALTFWFDTFSLPATETFTVENVEFQLSNGAFGIYARNGTSGVNNAVMNDCIWSAGGGTSFDIKCLGDLAAGVANVVVNDSTFTGNSDVGAEVTVGGSITLNDCSMTAGNNNLIFASAGTVTVNGGTLTDTNASYYAAFAAGGDVIINNCTINSSGPAGSYISQTSAGSLTVNGGTAGEGPWYIHLASGGVSTFNGVMFDGTLNTLGIGLYNNGGTLNVYDCFCSNWSQQPVLVLAGGITNVSETVFSTNTNYDIQIASGGSTTNIYRSVITAANGISTTVGASDINIDHCTFLGGLYAARDIVGGNNNWVVKNSIVASTFGLNDLDTGNGTFTSSYNNVVSPSGYQGVSAGVGDIMVDPLFANPPADWNGPGQPDLSGTTLPDDLIPQDATVISGDEVGGTMGAFQGNLDPDISTSSDLTFGVVEISTSSAPQTVTITNNGSGDLTITSVMLTGTDPTEFSIFSDTGESTLATSETRTIEILFSPTSVGPKSANVTIASDDPADPTVNVALSGEGSTVTNVTDWEVY